MCDSKAQRATGRHNDSQALQHAISLAAVRPGSTVYLPAGVYYCPTAIRLASHVNLRGASVSSSWLEGQLDFASHSTISKLKIGTFNVSAVTNLPGATHTTFTGVRFRGGGRAFTPVVVLGGCRGSHRSCSFITFERCEVERNLGVETDPPSRNLNDITLFSSYAAGETVVHNITFDHCHVGVSNGQKGWNIGSPRMALEAWADDHTRSGDHLTAAQTAHRPYYDLTITNCVFEATDWSTLDFADGVTCYTKHPYAHTVTGVVVSGNVLHGAGHRWTKDMGRITFEGPADSVCKNNTIYQGGALGNGIQVRSWEKGDIRRSGNTFLGGYGHYVPSPNDP